MGCLAARGRGGANEQGDSEAYQPARPGDIRQALRAMPVRDVREYRFIDLGSGKGRALFVAAEMPFRRVIGVEFSGVLHGVAEHNLQRFRRRPGGAAGIRSLHGLAESFVFPAGPLVLYLYNPFGAVTMAHVMERLAESLAFEPRHVVVLLLWARCSEQVLAVPGMRVVQQCEEFEIFEVGEARSV